MGCGCRKFTCDVLGDHFLNRVKTQQVVKNRGQECGDIELTTYLSNTVGPVTLVIDLCITLEHWGSSSNPSLNGHLYYPTDIDRTLKEVAADKVLQYRDGIASDYNNTKTRGNMSRFQLKIAVVY